LIALLDGPPLQPVFGVLPVGQVAALLHCQVGELLHQDLNEIHGRRYLLLKALSVGGGIFSLMLTATAYDFVVALHRCPVREDNLIEIALQFREVKRNDDIQLHQRVGRGRHNSEIILLYVSLRDEADAEELAQIVRVLGGQRHCSFEMGRAFLSKHLILLGLKGEEVSGHRDVEGQLPRWDRRIRRTLKVRIKGAAAVSP
jgi:hypothetical protein